MPWSPGLALSVLPGRCGFNRRGLGCRSSLFSFRVSDPIQLAGLTRQAVLRTHFTPSSNDFCVKPSSSLVLLGPPKRHQKAHFESRNHKLLSARWPDRVAILTVSQGESGRPTMYRDHLPKSFVARNIKNGSSEWGFEFWQGFLIRLSGFPTRNLSEALEKSAGSAVVNDFDGCKRVDRRGFPTENWAFLAGGAAQIFTEIVYLIRIPSQAYPELAVGRLLLTTTECKSRR